MPQRRVLTRLTRLAGFDREPAAARARPLRASLIGRNAALRGLRATGFRLRARHRHTNRKPNWLARNRNWLARKAPAYQPQADLACAQPDFACARANLVQPQVVLACARADLACAQGNLGGRPGSGACAWLLRVAAGVPSAACGGLSLAAGARPAAGGTHWAAPGTGAAALQAHPGNRGSQRLWRHGITADGGPRPAACGLKVIAKIGGRPRPRTAPVESSGRPALSAGSSPSPCPWQARR